MKPFDLRTITEPFYRKVGEKVVLLSVTQKADGDGLRFEFTFDAEGKLRTRASSHVAGVVMRPSDSLIDVVESAAIAACEWANNNAA